MVHDGQGLPLGLEACDDIAGVQPGVHDLDGDLPPHRRLLASLVDHPEAALTQRPLDGVGADDRADRRGVGRGTHARLALADQPVGPR